MAGSAGIAAFSIAGGIIVARHLGPVGRGELALLLLWPQLISTLGNLGVDLGATYFSADSHRRQNVPATVIRVAAFQTALICPIYLVLAPVLFRSSHLGWLPFAVAVLIPIDLIALYLVHALNGRHDYRAFNLARASMAPAYAVGVFVLAVIGWLTVGAAVAVFAVGNGLIAVLALWLTARRYGLGRFELALARKITRFGLRSHIGRLSPQGLGLDVVIVALVLGPRELGLFAAALSFLGVGRLLIASAGFVVFPEVRAADLRGHSSVRIRETIGLTVVVMASLALGLWLAGRPMAALLFGDGFRSAGTIAPILAAGEVARGAYTLLLEGIRGSGRPGLTTAVEACNWVVFALCLVVAAAIGGLLPIASGMALGSAISLTLLLVVAGRSGGLAFLAGAAHGRRRLATEVGA